MLIQNPTRVRAASFLGFIPSALSLTHDLRLEIRQVVYHAQAR